MLVAHWKGKAVSENNRLLWTKSRNVPNPKYTAFKNSVAMCLRAVQLDKPPIKRPAVRLFIHLNPRMDASNIIKPVFDAIQLAGVVQDDLHICDGSFHREDRKKGNDDQISIYVLEKK